MKRATAAATVLLLLATAVSADESAFIEAEGAQRAVGYACSQAGAGYDLLGEEYEINFGRAEAVTVERTRRTLAEVSDEDVPSVAADIRNTAKVSRAELAEHVAELGSRQQAILEKIRSILAVHATDVSARMLAERVAALIQAQRDLEEDTRTFAGDSLGKRVDELSAQQKTALENLTSRQQDLAAQVQSLDSAGDPFAASREAERRPSEGVRPFESPLLDAAEASMRDSADSLSENRSALSLTAQADAIEKLEAFKRTLEGTQAPFDPAAALRALADAQAELRRETSSTENSDGLEGLADRQRDLRGQTDAVAARLAQAPLAERFTRAASEAMHTAAEAASRAAAAAGADRPDPQEALAAQRRAEDFLRGATAALGSPGLESALAALEDSSAETAEAIRALEDLQNLIERQETLEDLTAQSLESSERLGPLAPAQEEIADELDRFRENERSRSPGGGEEASLAEARESMGSAAGNLRQSRGESALNDQEAALASLGRARRRLMDRILAQARESDTLLQAARESGLPEMSDDDLMRMTGHRGDSGSDLENAARALALSDEQAGLAESVGRRGSGEPSLDESAAVSEDALAAQASGIAATPEADGRFLAAAEDAHGRMRDASGLLRGGSPLEAFGRMNEAAALLESAAAFSMASAFPSSQRLPSRGDPQGRGISPGEAAASPTPPPVSATRTWAAKLPPGTPPDLMQAAQGAFPRGYEGALRRYYESLASEAAEK